MRKKALTIAALCIVAVGLTACGHEHVWKEATCLAPRTCSECGQTEGEAADHQWVDATCEKAKYCEVCGKEEGKPSDHEWIDATYTAPKTCSLCGLTEGEPLAEPYYLKNELTFDRLTDMELPFAIGFSDGEKLVKIEGMWIETGSASFTFGEITSQPSTKEGYIDIIIPWETNLSAEIYDASDGGGGYKVNYTFPSFAIGDCYTGLQIPERSSYNDDVVEYGKDFEWEGNTYSVSYKKEVNLEKISTEWELQSEKLWHKPWRSKVSTTYTVTIPKDYDGATLVISKNGSAEVSFESSVDKTIEDKEQYLLDGHDKDEYFFYRVSDLIK